jgi:23S rRNA (guanosine2251-2'-O)-methyltransferase
MLFPLILVLDNVRSANNVGSLFRTADGAGCSQIMTVGITPHPNGHGAEKLQKTAMGAERTVPSQHFASLQAAIAQLRSERPHYQLLGVETTKRSIVYTDYAFAAKETGGVALVLGNEVTGVDATLLPSLDGIVEIPMFGIKNSLNVAVCAPIILYEIHRQWHSMTKE